ncbi:phosphate-starvation-inducible protein PsiE [Bacillus salipaludis]|uniref:Protein PsiE n=1 Tax=Bacillus salipaludis TaxID=2547811 RepID=A0A4R5VWW5_9BACI|nr:phosphate-starvation-inducible protein PsiE [Bacillus salipaludis]MDQ6595303.1 phosphate-starvation-inducible protein PsiE [Bacillus salipaludis]TDK63860.1 phosphate-starvation-inducible protein PsiE [Bacillus salipaludis]
MFKIKNGETTILCLIPKILQLFLNMSLVLLGIILSILLVKELIIFIQILVEGGNNDFKIFLANILIFFLYFEFISMIVKYFKEEYHFPIRYFIYIGITAMVRIIIVDHEHPVNSLFYAFIILILIIGYFIINFTPRERPDSAMNNKK